MKEVESALEDPTVWNNPKRAQDLGRKKKSLEDVVLVLDRLTADLSDNSELFEMSRDDGDEAGITTIEAEATPDQDTQWRGGLELEVVPNFDLRAGIMTNPNKLTAGFGYAHRGVAVHYGFSTGGGVLDSTHQFGLSVSWGGGRP